MSSSLYACAALVVVAACNDHDCSSFPDLSVQDDSGAADLSMPQDLSVLADLSVPEDLSELDLLAADLPPSEGGVRFTGRIDESDPTAPRFAWSGSSVAARFVGSSVSVHLDDPASHFQITIDGQSQPTLVGAGDQTYPLAAGLAPGTHELLIYRQSEAFFGPTTFLGLSFPGGGVLLPPPPANPHRIELVGDSISCGYGDAISPVVCGQDMCTENFVEYEDHYDSYGAVAARSLKSDLVTLCWSGSTLAAMSARYDYALPSPTAVLWDYSRYVPELVMINLGTNDFLSSDPGPSFTDDYVAFLQHVRSNYPNAWIMSLIGPLTTSPSARIMDALAAFGDPRTSFFAFPIQNWNAAGCQCHPTLSDHQAMATALSAEIKTRLGW